MSRPAEPGDWVKLTRTVPTSFTDQLTGDGLRAGTQALVITRHGRRLQIDADAGWGTVTATIDATDAVVVRRDGGTDRWQATTHRRTTARLALALALAWPILSFATQYIWLQHSLDGLPGAIALGIVSAIPDQVEAFLNEPVKAVLYIALTTALARIAFGRTR
ncbi:hypothetical protein [Intrasporangium sp.]|uniref:hypothetical protein n=1 Tax=Intrasporangium sp. TaxID=1925024 RepID=UPI00322166BE